MDYKEKNRNSWNQRTEVHYTSEFYDNDSFIKGRNSLNSIELGLLENIKGKSILHLQCHFGQDTISLERLGAKALGVDLSDKAIEKANELAKETGSSARFICCDIYDLPQHLDEKFDVVYTSYGVIGWLPDLNRWAKLISNYLKPGGELVLVEFHPVVWMFDDHFKEICYSYFNVEPIVETTKGTYTEGEVEEREEITWNHPLDEVLNSLIRNGLRLDSLDEYDYSPYNCFNGTEEFEPGKFRIKSLGNRIPMVYSIKATKPL